MLSLAYLNKYFWKYRGYLLGGIIFVILQNFGAIYPAQVVRKTLDEVIGALRQMEGLDAAGRSGLLEAVTAQVFRFFLLILGVALLRGVLMFLMRQTIIVMSRHIEYDLKNEIFDHYQRLSLSFYRRNNTGDLMNRISEDVSRVRMYVGPAVMYAINLVVMFVLVIISMWHVNHTLTLYVLAPLPLLSVSIYFVSDIMNRRSEEVQVQQSRLSTYVQEAFSGIRVLKSFVREKSSVETFREESERYLRNNMHLVRVNALFFPLMLLLVGLSTLLVVYVGGREVIAGRATNGNIAEFIIYVNMLTWPVASLGWVTSLVQRAAASQVRINEFLTQQPDILNQLEGAREMKGAIRFRDVSFMYPDSGIRALEQVTFSVEPGRSLAILGKTGSGKSTVANLIVRLYDPTSGSISIDGTDLREWPLDELRRQIGYVPQDVFLFSDSIANNISFGLEGDDDPAEIRQRVEAAARNAAVDDNIWEFPAGYETLLGERGITLSGGQKQRVSIARAIIRNPKILVFDDCLSAVDTQTEERILRNLREVMVGRTTLFISHRVSTVRHADHILVLDNGSILEAGTHEDLLNRRGAYFELYESQLLEEHLN
jgi:ATP-binding cassette subfamily B protein